MLQKALGRRIRQLRDKRGWTQQQLAEKVGAESGGYIYKWEKGIHFPEPEYLEALAKAFSIHVGELFTFPDEPDL